MPVPWSLSSAKSLESRLWRPRPSIDTLPSINPATGEVFAHFERTQRPSSRDRFACSHCQSVWGELSVRDRCARLRMLRDRIMASRNELAEAVVRESGKPRVEALFADVFVALDSAEYCPQCCGSSPHEARPHHSTAAKAKRGYLLTTSRHHRYHFFVNYPLAIPLSQIIPAVAAGNAVVCKTSDFTPQSVC